jgi:hypothetical protein
LLFVVCCLLFDARKEVNFEQIAESFLNG